MICVFDIGNTNFSGNGDAVLTPTSGNVRQVAGGSYDLTMEHPIDPEGKWRHLVPGAVVRVPVPKETIPNAYSGIEADIYKTNTQTELRETASEPETVSYQTWTAGTSYAVGSKVTYLGKNYRCAYMDATSAFLYLDPAHSSWWVEIANKTKGGTVLATMKTGTQIYLVESHNADWYKMRTFYGLTGYVKKSDVTFYKHVTPSENQAHVIEDQLFRLKEPTINTEKQTVSVTGQHVSYDLAGILVKDVSISDASPAMAIGQITDAFMMDYDGVIATDLTKKTGGTYTGEIRGKNGLFTLLDPDLGIVNQFEAKLTRDNWDFYIMEKPSNPPVECVFRNGKNTRGVNWKRSSANIVTRVVPVAKDEKGEDLYLPEKWVDSSDIGDYPVIIMERLAVQGQVGKTKSDDSDDTWTENDLLDEMRAKAAERFSIDKADQVKSEITIQFEQTGDTAEYAWLKKLQSVLLYDVVNIIDDNDGLNETLEVTELEYNIIKKKVSGVKLSNVENEIIRTVTGYSVQNNSISMDKLMDGVAESIVGEAVAKMPEYADPNAERPASNIGLNTKDEDGIVKKGQGNANKVWKTDGNGVPAWRSEGAGEEEAYAAGDSIYLPAYLVGTAVNTNSIRFPIFGRKRIPSGKVYTLTLTLSKIFSAAGSAVTITNVSTSVARENDDMFYITASNLSGLTTGAAYTWQTASGTRKISVSDS